MRKIVFTENGLKYTVVFFHNTTDVFVDGEGFRNVFPLSSAEQWLKDKVNLLMGV